jgi:hypothetical protein
MYAQVKVALEHCATDKPTVSRHKAEAQGIKHREGKAEAQGIKHKHRAGSTRWKHKHCTSVRSLAGSNMYSSEPAQGRASTP